MNHQIFVQYASDKSLAPKLPLIRKWAKAALGDSEACEITVRIVDIDEMTMLNSKYRHKTGPTNVLSFPFKIQNDVELETPILGDIVVCSQVVNQEAKEQNKSLDAHWAHMIVHSVFHLLGYDHHSEAEAKVMEGKEIAVLKQLGFDDPYQEQDRIHDE